jgi:hypothetical protein
MALAASSLARDLEAVFAGKDEQRFAPLAVMTFRFDGQRVAHVGNALNTALELYLAVAGASPPTWLFGHYWKAGGKHAEVRQPKDFRTAATRKFVREVLAMTSALPATFNEGLGIDFVAKDGPRPWKEDGMLVSECAGLQFALDALDDKWSPGGTLSFGFPLSELEDSERLSVWLELGDRIFAVLGASVGWLAPALWSIPRTMVNAWSHELTDDELATLCTRFPQVDLPILYSGNSDLYAQGWVPGATRGLIGVSWVNWLESELARPVVSFAGLREDVGAGAVRLMVEASPPLDMNEARYALYRKAKAALAPVLLRYNDEETWRERAYLQRFDAEDTKLALEQVTTDRKASQYPLI